MKKGQSLIELIIVIGLMAILLPALITGIVSSRSGQAQQKQRLEAVSVLKETNEAVRSIREKSWLDFLTLVTGPCPCGPFHPEINSGSWQFVSGVETLSSGLTREVWIYDINRDSNGNIAVSGTNDPSTKKVNVIVKWFQPQNSQIDSIFYLTRFRENISYVETTQTQFNAGSKSSVKVQATNPPQIADDGEIVLSQTGGFGDWCTPALTFTALDLPKNGVANAVSAIQGQAAAATGDNASGVSYANITITDPAYPTPPVAAVAGIFDGYKTNGVFTEQQYAYLATDTSHKQGVIIDLTPGNYTDIGWLDVGTGSIKGQSIFVLNDIAYLTATDNKLYTFNIATRTGNHASIGSVNLAGLGQKVIVVSSGGNTFAYIAVNSTTNQLQIVNVANPNSLPAPTSISINGQGATDIYVNVPQNRAYLVTAQSATKSEFFLINLANNTVLGSYDTNAHGDMNPKGVVAVSGAKVIIVGTGGQEYQILRVDGDNESAPLWCGGLDVNTGINGIATVFTSAQRAYSYIITGDKNAELKIIEGGPGGSGAGNYVPTGTFISQPFGPTTNDTNFNRFIANINQPTINDVQLQFAVADPVSSSCVNSSYTFIGTDNTGTSTSHYFTTSVTGSTTLSGTIPFSSYAPSYKNPSKCFKYKVILNTSDSTLTPVFKDITINYSP